jgi:hypothetical protein
MAYTEAQDSSPFQAFFANHSQEMKFHKLLIQHDFSRLQKRLL